MSQPDSDTEAPSAMESATATSAPGALVYRHRLATRIWHWTNAFAVFILLMSGLMIFNAHPALYWGQYGANYDTPWLRIGANQTAGFVEIGGLRVNTTGVLGRWKDPEGVTQTRAFPHWATIPSRYDLAGARRWHLAFAWLFAVSIIVFWIVSLANRHVQRDLSPRRMELSPRHIWHDIVEHAKLRFPIGEAALRYNILQKLSYVGMIFVVLPLLILTGLTMSPGMNAAWPWLLDIFGGRQSARSIHFIAAGLTALFIIIPLLMVLLAGPINEIRSMITGRFRVPVAKNVESKP